MDTRNTRCIYLQTIPQFPKGSRQGIVHVRSIQGIEANRYTLHKREPFQDFFVTRVECICWINLLARKQVLVENIGQLVHVGNQALRNHRMSDISFRNQPVGTEYL